MKNRTLYRLFGILFILLILSQFLSMELYQVIAPKNGSTPIVLPTLLSSFSSIAIMPFIEEWLFREKLLFFLLKKTSYWKSILISSFLFSMIHLQLFSLPFFLGGIIYSLARLKSNKWWFPVLLHSSYNGIAILLMYVEVFFS